MAEKKKPSARAKDAQSTRVTRITAADDAPKKPKAAKKPTKKSDKTVATPAAKAKTATAPAKKKADAPRRNPLAAIGGYFRGAWHELRQVRWPTRRVTWGLTLAVLAFTGFFLALIMLLDYGFQWVFERILG